MDGLQWKSLLNWMIWGYHHFRKHPYIFRVDLRTWGMTWVTWPPTTTTLTLTPRLPWPSWVGSSRWPPVSPVKWPSNPRILKRNKMTHQKRPNPVLVVEFSPTHEWKIYASQIGSKPQGEKKQYLSCHHVANMFNPTKWRRFFFTNWFSWWLKGWKISGSFCQSVFPGKILSAFFQNVWSHPGRKRKIYRITKGMLRVRTTAHSHLRRCATKKTHRAFWKTPIRIEFTLLKTSGKSVDIYQFWNGSIGSTRRFFMPSSNWSWRKICHEMDRCILFMKVRKFQSSCVLFVLFLYFFDGFPNPIQNGHFEEHELFHIRFVQPPGGPWSATENRYFHGEGIWWNPTGKDPVEDKKLVSSSTSGDTIFTSICIYVYYIFISIIYIHICLYLIHIYKHSVHTYAHTGVYIYIPTYGLQVLSIYKSWFIYILRIRILQIYLTSLPWFSDRMSNPAQMRHEESPGSITFRWILVV